MWHILKISKCVQCCVYGVSSMCVSVSLACLWQLTCPISADSSVAVVLHCMISRIYKNKNDVKCKIMCLCVFVVAYNIILDWYFIGLGSSRVHK